MGLTSWRKSPHGKIYPSDIAIARNYLNKEELDFLNRIVTMYLDYAEMQAVRNRPMYMKDWSEKLNAFLKFNEYEILTHNGKVSHEVAVALAQKEYDSFRKIQDESYLSDFDKELRRISGKKNGNS
ncbi:MAG: virulence RhuM family protein [Fibrobacter sp.]|nr:virulence RhuM family protein [Fibrobacter sp.]